MTALVQDLRYALRSLRNNPGFAAVAVVTLALGIGANTAIFSVVNAVLLRSLPYPDSGRLVLVGERWMGGGGDFAPPDFADIAAQNHVFEQMAATRGSTFNLSIGERPERVSGAIVTVNTFTLLGVKPLLGRTFLSGDGGVGGERVVVLSEGLWKARFGGRPDIVGQRLELDGEPYTIVGVMPASFDFPEQTQIWLPPRFSLPEHPLRPATDPLTMPGSHYFESIARLRPGVTLVRARADVDAAIRHIAERRPDTEAVNGAWIQTLQESEVGDVRLPLEVLLAAVGLVLLIACANVANLLLARGAARRKEIAIRNALGAGRAALLRQLMVESLLLASLGGLAGILLAYWGGRPLIALLPARLKEISILQGDWSVLAFTALAALLAAFFFGLTPAIQAMRFDVVESLKGSGRTSKEGRGRAQRVLIVMECALAAVLLVSAGLLVRSFLRLMATSQGFDPSHVITLKVSLPPARYPDPGKRNAFVTRVLEGVNALPGVASAGVGSRVPLGSGESHRGIEIQGRPHRDGEDLDMFYSVVTPGYFRTFGIPLVRGRDFTTRDDAAAPGVVLINAAAARAYWPDANPLGARVKINGDKLWEVVGVVGDTHQRDLSQPVEPAIYVSYAQDPWPFLTVAVRAFGDPAGIALEAQSALQTVDKSEAVYDVATMPQIIGQSLEPRRFSMLLLLVFAVMALALAAIGVFGVISFAAAQRRQEIGIRMALGAERSWVLKMVLLDGLRLASTGLIPGLLVAAGVTRWFASLLYGVRPLDPVIFGSVAGVLAGAALLASYVPARRATKVDPMVALRHE